MLNVKEERKWEIEMNRRFRGTAGVRRCTLLVAVALMVPLTSLAVASQASATEPTGDFARFKQCPRFTTGVNLCFYSNVYGGKVTLNKQTVPINEDKKHEIILQGGIMQEEEPPFHEKFVAALNGETLSKTPQNVPGGLTGLVNCTEIKGEGFLEGLARAACKLVFENKTTGVQAITELAKPASEIGISKRNLLAEEGTALSLPVKIRLENTFLGSECYIGSSSHPVVLSLTTGETSPAAPNKPIHGHVGEIKQKDEFEFIEIPKTILVNNEFAAPEASGCGGIFAILIDPLIDSKIGLPSPDGHNTVIQEANIYEGTTVAVIKSEK
jgi:hypothetical protein